MTLALVTVDLDTIAADVRDQWERGRAGYLQATDAYLAIGSRLAEARTLLPSDQAFGEWFRGQDFPFSRQWAWTLRRAAESEADIRAVVASQLATGKGPNIEQALAAIRNGAIAVREAETLAGVYSTVVSDPPWQYGNTATRASAEKHYPTMSLEAIEALPVHEWAAVDAHLYLWTTNGFLREAFSVAEAWGFTYRTCLTWVKPQIGIGNWFRPKTEHVLFCTRGHLPIPPDRRAGNVIEANRTQHSAKPDSFYDMVERVSPGPYLDMFSRRRRFGWEVWGLEA